LTYYPSEKIEVTPAEIPIRNYLEKTSVIGSRKTARCRNELMVPKVKDYSGPGLIEKKLTISRKL